MEQVSRFTDGGFVVHKARISGSRCKFSVWFDREGVIIDAEAKTEAGKVRTVPRPSPQWAELARLGRVYGP